MYKVTIERTEVEVKVLPKKWERLTSDSDDNSVYGYTPETTTEDLVTHQVFEQVFDNLILDRVVVMLNEKLHD